MKRSAAAAVVVAIAVAVGIVRLGARAPTEPVVTPRGDGIVRESSPAVSASATPEEEEAKPPGGVVGTGSVVGRLVRGLPPVPVPGRIRWIHFNPSPVSLFEVPEGPGFATSGRTRIEGGLDAGFKNSCHLPAMDIFRHADTDDYPMGTVICREGEPGEHLYAIQEGSVELRSGDMVLATLGAGEIFGEMALIDFSPRSATAVALEDSKIAAIDRKRFQFLVQNTPFFSLQVMHVMAARLRGADAKLAGLKP